MISFKELIGDKNVSDIPIQHQQNLEELLKRINVVRSAYNAPMIVTSGYRTIQDHLRIYSEKMGKDYDVKKVPMQSNHLSGKAVDISDANGSLMKFCKSNENLLVTVGLWMEDGTIGWAHFQMVPVLSGKRFFKP